LLNNVRYIVTRGENVRFVKIFPSFEFGSDNEHQEHDTPSGRLEIIHVGRIAGGKGQIDAVDACEALCNENIAYRFTMLGDLSNNDYGNALAKTIGGSECKNSYTMPGFVDDVANYLRASDIFLFPSSGEGMPNSFIEALNQGCICIAYSNTVFPEFAELGFYLHLANDGDIGDLTRVLLEVTRNISTERKKAFRNRQLVRRYFQRTRELSDWHEILV
jgi:glycosyltransferase involved in cell wall biosynthesis